ncbi:hypothetical protein PENTCL1PPCAC_23105, partial [Pristionchus entomophagus]
MRSVENEDTTKDEIEKKEVDETPTSDFSHFRRVITSLPFLSIVERIGEDRSRMAEERNKIIGHLDNFVPECISESACHQKQDENEYCGMGNGSSHRLVDILVPDDNDHDIQDYVSHSQPFHRELKQAHKINDGHVEYNEAHGKDCIRCFDIHYSTIEEGEIRVAIPVVSAQSKHNIRGDMIRKVNLALRVSVRFLKLVCILQKRSPSRREKNQWRKRLTHSD